jgi:hypothetical protein
MYEMTMSVARTVTANAWYGNSAIPPPVEGLEVEELADELI